MKKEPLFVDMLFGGDLKKKEDIRYDTYKKMIDKNEKIVLL